MTTDTTGSNKLDAYKTTLQNKAVFKYAFKNELTEKLDKRTNDFKVILSDDALTVVYFDIAVTYLLEFEKGLTGHCMLSRNGTVVTETLAVLDSSDVIQYKSGDGDFVDFNMGGFITGQIISDLEEELEG